MLALRWLVEGYGYEITSDDVWAAYTSVMAVAKGLGNADETHVEIEQMVAGERPPAFVGHVLARKLQRRNVGVLSARAMPTAEHAEKKPLTSDRGGLLGRRVVCRVC